MTFSKNRFPLFREVPASFGADHSGFKQAAMDAFRAGVAAATRHIPEHFQAKRRPVRVKKTRRIKKLEPHFDSNETARLQRQNWRCHFSCTFLPLSAD
jgi:hypothetical protein